MEEIFYLMNELINWVEIIDQVETIDKLHKKGRKVRFNPFDTTYIIENREDIRNNLLHTELWWREQDYAYFKYMAILQYHVEKNKEKESEKKQDVNIFL
jgi:hypothetical protein